MSCRYCGVNHESRDFLRATLLRILDQFETSSQFKEFMSEQNLSSPGLNNLKPDKPNIRKREQEALSTIIEKSGIKSELIGTSKLSEKLSIPVGVPTIIVEQSQTKAGVEVILHRVGFAAEYTVVFLTIENNSINHHDIWVSDYSSLALQGDSEFHVNSRGPNYRSFQRIKYGTKKYGAIKFKKLQYSGPSIIFKFGLNGLKGPSKMTRESWLFEF